MPGDVTGGVMGANVGRHVDGMGTMGMSDPKLQQNFGGLSGPGPTSQAGGAAVGLDTGTSLLTGGRKRFGVYNKMLAANKKTGFLDSLKELIRNLKSRKIERDDNYQSLSSFEDRSSTDEEEYQDMTPEEKKEAKYNHISTR